MHTTSSDAQLDDNTANMQGHSTSDRPIQDRTATPLNHNMDEDSPPQQALDDILEHEQVETMDDEPESDLFYPKYDLRPQTRESTSHFTSTWLDNDKTGLYDPAEERRKLRQRPKRSNLLQRSLTSWYSDESEGQTASFKERAHTIPRLEITLRFESEAGKTSFRKRVLSPPVRSEPTHEICSERRLRRRDSGVALSRAFTSGISKKHRIPVDLPQDLTGHPAARGCWECLAIGIRCPLLDDERAWPCTACTDDDHECELITPPKYKRTCERCKNKRLPCSYGRSLDHSEACEECSRDGWDCIAGPARESIQPRIRYDRDWENDPYVEPKPPKIKKMPSCRRCQESGQACSFSAGDNGEECTACEMAGANCVRNTEKAPKAGRKRKREGVGPVAKSKSRADTDPDDKEDSSPQRAKKSRRSSGVHRSLNLKGTGGDDFLQLAKGVSLNQYGEKQASEVADSDEDDDSSLSPLQQMAPGVSSGRGTPRTITTSFSHPIKFNSDGRDPCMFCLDDVFPIFGMGSKEVEVIEWHDGRGLEEIKGGHRGEGVESTRMCLTCTTDRLSIVLCAKHELRPLEGEYTS